MTPQRKRLLIILIPTLAIGLALAAAYLAYLHLRPTFKLVLRGSTGSHGQLSISGGNLVVLPDTPGVYFGTVHKPGTPDEQFSYIILFRYPRTAPTSRSLQTQNTSDNRTAQTTDAIELDGKRIEAVYRIELDESLMKVTTETLTLGGKPIDPTSGRLFLVDFNAPTPSYEQKNIPLPPIPKSLQTPDDVERLSRELLKYLESHDPKLKS